MFKIFNKKYFIAKDERGMGNVLVLKGSWSRKFVDVIKRKDISILRLSQSAGWHDEDILFLKELKDLNLIGVEVYSWEIKDISPLQYLPDLKLISLQTSFTKEIDFQNFKNLTYFFSNWRPKLVTIFNSVGLKSLNLVNYPYEDLSDLSQIKGLKELQLTSRKLSSLNGVQSLQSLEYLDLFSCTQLRSLKGIEDCSQLQCVEVESCNKIVDISQYGDLIK